MSQTDTDVLADAVKRYREYARISLPHAKQGWEGKAAALQRIKDALPTRLADAAVRDAAKPFGMIADIILAEAPPDVETWALFVDCEGNKFHVALETFRRLQAALKELGQ